MAERKLKENQQLVLSLCVFIAMVTPSPLLLIRSGRPENVSRPITSHSAPLGWSSSSLLTKRVSLCACLAHHDSTSALNDQNEDIFELWGHFSFMRTCLPVSRVKFSFTVNCEGETFSCKAQGSRQEQEMLYLN